MCIVKALPTWSLSSDAPSLFQPRIPASFASGVPSVARLCVLREFYSVLRRAATAVQTGSRKLRGHATHAGSQTVRQSDSQAVSSSQIARNRSTQQEAVEATGGNRRQQGAERGNRTQQSAAGSSRLTQQQPAEDWRSSSISQQKTGGGSRRQREKQEATGSRIRQQEARRQREAAGGSMLQWRTAVAADG